MHLDTASHPRPVRRNARLSRGVVIWAALAGLALLPGCRRQETSRLDLLTLLPAPPTYLVRADIPRLTASPAWERVRDREIRLPEHYGRFQAFLDQAGIDIEQDLDSLVMAFYPRDHAAGSFAAILTGRFDEEQLRAALAEEGFLESAYRDTAVFSPAISDKRGASEKPAGDWTVIVFDHTAVGLSSAEEGTLAMIDRRLDGGDRLDDHPELGPLLASVDREAPIWGVGLLPSGVARGITADLPVQGLPAFDNLFFSIGVSPELTIRLQSRFPDPDTASRAAEQLNGLITFFTGIMKANTRAREGDAPGNGGSTANALDLLERLTVTAEEDRVMVSMAVPDDLVPVLWPGRSAHDEAGGPDAGETK